MFAVLGPSRVFRCFACFLFLAIVSLVVSVVSCEKTQSPGIIALVFVQTRRPSCRPTNSVAALKENLQLKAETPNRKEKRQIGVLFLLLTDLRVCCPTPDAVLHVKLSLFKIQTGPFFKCTVVFMSAF